MVFVPLHISLTSEKSKKLSPLQTGVAMGSKIGPNYTCLFVAFVEDQMLNQHSGFIPQLYRRNINDVVGAAYCGREDLKNFVEYISNFHPALQFTHTITEDGYVPSWTHNLRGRNNHLCTLQSN